jgi:hypothetical protein
VPLLLKKEKEARGEVGGGVDEVKEGRTNLEKVV